MDINTFQSQIHVHFQEPALLQQALTHRSFVNEQDDEKEVHDNERLEFLGDAVLDFITASLLYKQFPDMPEGQMTRLRAALVRTESLAKLARECGLGEAMLMGKGEENSGGRQRNNNLCSGFEAVVGAVYLDQGLETVKAFVTPLLLELQEEVMEEALRKDPRSQFQEWAQAEHSITPEYQVVDTIGPDHDKEFTVVAILADQMVAAGNGHSKRAGAQSAARAALDKLELAILPFVPLPENTYTEPATELYTAMEADEDIIPASTTIEISEERFR